MHDWCSAPICTMRNNQRVADKDRMAQLTDGWFEQSLGVGARIGCSVCNLTSECWFAQLASVRAMRVAQSASGRSSAGSHDIHNITSLRRHVQNQIHCMSSVCDCVTAREAVTRAGRWACGGRFRPGKTVFSL